MNATGKIRLRITLLLFGSSLAVIALTFISTNLMEVWQVQKQTPCLAADSMVKALRTHHRQTGRFPIDFRELESRVWKHKNPPDFGADGRSLSIANYHYLYHPVSTGTCTIWIIP